MQRKIIHIDMDAFYASVEQRDQPSLKGLPVVVGGSKGGRGVVAAASYEARRYGIHSAMSSIIASRLCPEAIFIKPRMTAYREVSAQIMEIMRSYSDLVEPLSLDEAYIDVTENRKNEKTASILAELIREEIYKKTNLTASAGVAPNKFLAKVASDLNKPNGICVIAPHRIAEVLDTLDVKKIPGVGAKTYQKMQRLGITTIRDLQQLGLNDLEGIFGKRGRWFFETSRGIDNRPVSARRIRKSMSVENTFAEDLLDLDTIEEKLSELAERLLVRASEKNVHGRTLTLKITYSDFRKSTRRITLEQPLTEVEHISSLAAALLKETQAGVFSLRLLGLGISNFTSSKNEQRVRSVEIEQLEFNF